MKKIHRELKREFPFAEIEVAPSSHLRLRLPNGRSVFTSATPSCPFWLRHVRADVRRLMKMPTLFPEATRASGPPVPRVGSARETLR